MVLRETRTKNSEEKAAALHNAQNAACGSCGFCTSYLIRSSPQTRTIGLLKQFFIELFEFCFPVDFRNMQRKRLNRTFQGTKDVAAHVAEWSQIYNTIGLEDTQEKIVKLFNSLPFLFRQTFIAKALILRSQLGMR
jgi:hypothetical protein